MFEDFSVIFSHYIPPEKILTKTFEERQIIGRRVEGNNPNAIYCFAVRRNGTKEDGTPNERSIENSNKAEILRPNLYEKYYRDTNLSFFFFCMLKYELMHYTVIKEFKNTSGIHNMA